MKSRLIKRIFGKLSKSMHANGSLTIITGANEPFYESMKNNLLFSILKFEPLSKVIVWNLGLSDEQYSDLQCIIGGFCEGSVILDYKEEELPPHYSMKNWNYAFKSYCIFHSLKYVNTDYCFWLDAGCALSDSLTAERNYLKIFKFYSPYSRTSVGELTHKDVLDDFYDSRLHYSEKRMLSSGVDGFYMHSVNTYRLISAWYNYGRVEHLLAPVGADLTNHRFDQSILSIIYYQMFTKVPYLGRYYYNIRIHLNKG